MKNWWVKIVLGFAAILLVLAASLLTSHLQSKSAVERYKDQLRAEGEKLTVDELLPPKADPEKNGVRLFNEACSYLSYGGAIDTNPPPTMRMVAPGKAMIGWEQPEIVSEYGNGLVTNTWKDIEQELKNYAPALDLFHQASTRPQLDFQLNYFNSSMFSTKYLIKMKEAALLLWPAVISDLNRVQTASAVTNLHTTLALVNAWKDERLVVSQLTRIAIAAIACGAQWEVLQGTNLTDSELTMLQRDWESMEFVRPMEHAMEMDRVWDVAMIQHLRTSSNSPTMSSQIFPSSSTVAGSFGSLLNPFNGLGQTAKRKTSDLFWRISWSFDDELRVLKGDQVMIECIRQIETNGFFKNAFAERDRKNSALGLNSMSDNWLRNTLDDEIWSSFADNAEATGHSVDRVLSIEATRNVVIAAIALKRYQLRHGIWPTDLKALVPEFLSEVPRDPVDGQPLRYRANADGTFTLYSIGSDGEDNGGDPTPTGSSKSLYWLRGRDWVWPQPATAEEVRNFYQNPPK